MGARLPQPALPGTAQRGAPHGRANNPFSGQERGRSSTIRHRHLTRFGHPRSPPVRTPGTRLKGSTAERRRSQLSDNPPPPPAAHLPGERGQTRPPPPPPPPAAAGGAQRGGSSGPAPRSRRRRERRPPPAGAAPTPQRPRGNPPPRGEPRGAARPPSPPPLPSPAAGRRAFFTLPVSVAAPRDRSAALRGRSSWGKTLREPRRLPVGSAFPRNGFRAATGNSALLSPHPGARFLFLQQV